MNSHAYAAPAPRHQAGVSLLEVLIAVVVLSIGLLGLARLHISTLKNNQSALERGMIVVQSYSIIDAMRADRTSAINGGFNITLEADAPTGSSFAATALAAWRAELTALLGEGATGAVSCNGAECIVTVRWNDERGFGGSTEQAFSTEVQL